MKGQGILFTMLFLVIVLAGISALLIFNYNGLVLAEKSVDEAKAQIATVCQRRLDLLPNLIETVKAYAAHERTTLTAVTAARTKAAAALRAVAGGKTGAEAASIAAVASTQAGLSTAIRGLFAVVEKYPDLRASSNFMALQDQFEGTENRISVARQRYNSAARYYNAKIETFPGVFLAPMFGFGERDYYEAEEKAYQGIKAQF